MQPVEQTLKERQWRDFEFRESGVSAEFLESNNMVFKSDSILYAEDLNNLVVNIYDTKARLINSLGAGNGRGPGEFLHISDLRIDESGNVWALDPMNNRATILNPKNKDNFQIIEFPVVPLRVLPVGTTEYLLEKRFDNYIKRYTLSGDFIDQMEVLVDDPPLWSGVLVSNFTMAPDKSIISALIHINYLVKYSVTGTIEYFRKPISSPDFPKIEPYYANDVGRVNSVDYTSWEQTTSGVHIVGDEIHVLIRNNFVWFPHEQRVESRRETVDVYNLENGDYQYSYKLPKQLQSMAVSNTHLAGIPENLGKLVIWEVKGGWK
ncbi:MAG: 6-bladed beta-propeller [Balneolaceae bacterium]